jgi:hypothetical protein
LSINKVGKSEEVTVVEHGVNEGETHFLQGELGGPIIKVENQHDGRNYGGVDGQMGISRSASAEGNKRQSKT